jgi:hypothetical protein
MMLGSHLFGMLTISQTGLELSTGGMGRKPVFSV